MKAQYYKITPKYEEWLGKRFFKWDIEQDMIVQVCFTTGEKQRGRASTPGINTISKSTFAGNYMVAGYIQPSTKSKFNKEAEKCYQFLINSEKL